MPKEILIDYEKEEEAARLKGSFLEFCRYFYEYVTGREFIVVHPIGRESRHITCCKRLMSVFRLETLRLVINIPPGGNKSTLLSLWVAWTWAHYPDSNYLYISYSHELAAKHTAFIRSVVSSKMYRYLFDIEIDHESRAKDSFKTTIGGSVKAFGSAGSITGQDAGLPHLHRFSGAVLLDDVIKPDEAHSDTIRERVISNYHETIRQRCRGINVPIIYIGQKVHEGDLASVLLDGHDIDTWDSVILKQEDDAGNILCPDLLTREQVDALKEKQPYVWAAQHQQCPIPAGGALFKAVDFVLLEEEPNCHVTFITVDTAETEKSWNDATVFSFFGIYDIETMGRKTGELGLHWIDCLEIRIEPRDLQETFLDFYANCVRYPKPPLMAAIEKKSTGVTLVSVLQELRGMHVRQIDRNKTIILGNEKRFNGKTQRFIDMEAFIKGKLISLPKFGKHSEMCIKHMSKITANNTHRHDDIADTLSDAIRLAFIEKTLYSNPERENDKKQILTTMNQQLQHRINLGKARNVGYSQKAYG